MDIESNNVEEVDDLQLLLVQRGLKRLPLNSTAQAQTTKLSRLAQQSMFLSGLVTSSVYWGLVLILIGVPLSTAALALLAILLFERVFWLLRRLAKALGILEWFNLRTLLARRSGVVSRLLLAFGWPFATVLLRSTSVAVSLLLVSRFTETSIVERLYLFIISIGQVTPFSSIRFYVILFCAALGIFVLATFVVTVRFGQPVTAAAEAVLIAMLFMLLTFSFLILPLGLIFGLGILLVIVGVPFGAVYIVESP